MLNRLAAALVACAVASSVATLVVCELVACGRLDTHAETHACHDSPSGGAAVQVADAGTACVHDVAGPVMSNASVSARGLVSDIGIPSVEPIPIVFALIASRAPAATSRAGHSRTQPLDSLRV